MFFGIFEKQKNESKKNITLASSFLRGKPAFLGAKAHKKLLKKHSKMLTGRSPRDF